MLKKAPHACLLANETGTGKTAAYGLSLYGVSMEALAMGRGRYRPHLVIVPASVILQTFKELQRFFGKFFVIFVYYGDTKLFPDTDDGAFRDAILTRHEFRDKLRALSYFPDCDKSTVSTLISPEILAVASLMLQARTAFASCMRVFFILPEMETWALLLPPHISGQ